MGCAAATDKTYEKFSRILIDLAMEKRYDSIRAKDKNGQRDMEVDAVDRDRRQTWYLLSLIEDRF